MKFFPKKLSLKWINQAYDNNELTPYELVDEILKRAEENKDKNIWIVAPSRELMEKYPDAGHGRRGRKGKPCDCASDRGGRCAVLRCHPPEGEHPCLCNAVCKGNGIDAAGIR